MPCWPVLGLVRSRGQLKSSELPGRCALLLGSPSTTLSRPSAMPPVFTVWGCCLEGDEGLLGAPREKLLALMEVTVEVAALGIVDLELLESLLGS